MSQAAIAQASSVQQALASCEEFRFEAGASPVSLTVRSQFVCLSAQLAAARVLAPHASTKEATALPCALPHACSW